MGGKKNGSDETGVQKAHLNGMGRDEMNLAEFPLATLADRVPQGCKTLAFEDCIWDRGQRRYVTRRLTISASDKFGLPTALDDEVILGLVQLSKANGFVNRQVQFSRYQLVHLLGWREEGKSYTRLEESLKRWLGVTLYYENAWWDRCRKKWVDAHFHLLDNLMLYHRSKRGERSAKKDDGKPLSSFTWNEIIFRSFQAGHLKSIDLEFYRTLKSAVAKRIYRFLDKRFHACKKRRFGLVRFASEHIGLSRNYDSAQLKRRLKPAIVELESRGYLKPLPARERYSCVRRGEWEIFFIKAAKPLQKDLKPCHPNRLEAWLIERGVTASTAVRLVQEYPADLVEKKIAVFDHLTGSRDSRVSKNPAGYLVQSIRKDYLPPAGFQKKASTTMKKLNRKVLSETKTPHQNKSLETKVFYVEQKRMENYLSGLSPAELGQLETAALKASSSILSKGYARAKESGNQKLVDEYRRCILERYLKTFLGAESNSQQQIKCD
ncbi:MAG: replication initiator protein A [Pirellulales bacterium]|nr:replication initiator protein A [Pirellulales bacterium]